MSIATDSTSKSVEAYHSSATQAILQWLQDSAGGDRGLEYARSALEWARRLPTLADSLPADVWQDLLKHLVASAAETAALDVNGAAFEADPLVHQLLAGELGLTLACQFPKTKSCRKLSQPANEALSAGMASLLDGEGLPHARHLARLYPLLACWTRCRVLANGRKGRCWSADTESQYRQLVRNVLRLSRRDGSLAFSTAADPDEIASLTAALALVGNDDDRSIASHVLPNAKKKAFRSTGKRPRAAVHSEWAAVSVLRPDWSRSSSRLTVLYPDKSCRVELGCGKDVLWSGDWDFDVRIDGVPVLPACEWFNTCWMSDKDCDYLELEIELGEDIRLQRHFLMARKDRFLFVADAVLGTHRAAIEYRSSLPLGQGIAFRRAAETREGVLMGQKPRAVVMPLALPEWIGSASGELQTDGLTLQLRKTALGSSLFAPLFIDLDPKRCNRTLARVSGQSVDCCKKCGLTWRQLTVAESLETQPADIAVGYRIATAGKQWLIYRSLTPPKNRTLLGHNLSGEMLVARFQRNGEVDSLIEIE
jgi:hypothetical protein